MVKKTVYQEFNMNNHKVALFVLLLGFILFISGCTQTTKVEEKLSASDFIPTAFWMAANSPEYNLQMCQKCPDCMSQVGFSVNTQKNISCFGATESNLYVNVLMTEEWYDCNSLVLSERRDKNCYLNVPNSIPPLSLFNNYSLKVCCQLTKYSDTGVKQISPDFANDIVCKNTTLESRC
jgi:hypothetical protein